MAPPRLVQLLLPEQVFLPEKIVRKLPLLATLLESEVGKTDSAVAKSIDISALGVPAELFYVVLNDVLTTPLLSPHERLCMLQKHGVRTWDTIDLSKLSWQPGAAGDSGHTTGSDIAEGQPSTAAEEAGVVGGGADEPRLGRGLDRCSRANFSTILDLREFFGLPSDAERVREFRETRERVIAINKKSKDALDELVREFGLQNMVNGFQDRQSGVENPLRLQHLTSVQEWIGDLIQLHDNSEFTKHAEISFANLIFRSAAPLLQDSQHSAQGRNRHEFFKAKAEFLQALGFRGNIHSTLPDTVATHTDPRLIDLHDIMGAPALRRPTHLDGIVFPDDVVVLCKSGKVLWTPGEQGGQLTESRFKTGDERTLAVHFHQEEVEGYSSAPCPLRNLEGFKRRLLEQQERSFEATTPEDELDASFLRDGVCGVISREEFSHPGFSSAEFAALVATEAAVGRPAEHFHAKLLLAGGAVHDALVGTGDRRVAPDLDYFLVLPFLELLPAEKRHSGAQAAMLRVLSCLKSLFEKHNVLETMQRSENAITFYLRNQMDSEGVYETCEGLILGPDNQLMPLCAVQVIGWYGSVFDVLNTFDLASSQVGFDGTRVYTTPKGAVSLRTRCNLTNLNDVSPQYIYRLLKYLDRGENIVVPLSAQQEPWIMDILARGHSQGHHCGLSAKGSGKGRDGTAPCPPLLERLLGAHARFAKPVGATNLAADEEHRHQATAVSVTDAADIDVHILDSMRDDVHFPREQLVQEGVSCGGRLGWAPADKMFERYVQRCRFEARLYESERRREVPYTTMISGDLMALLFPPTDSQDGEPPSIAIASGSALIDHVFPNRRMPVPDKLRTAFEMPDRTGRGSFQKRDPVQLMCKKQWCAESGMQLDHGLRALLGVDETAESDGQ